MKTGILPFAAVAMGVLSAVGFCSPMNRSQIPAGVKWVFHADYEAFSASQLGQLVKEEVALHHQRGIDALAQLLGTDLLNDITSLTVFGPDGDEANAVALIRGKFDRTKLAALLALNPAYGEGSYDERTLYYWQEEMRGKNQVGTFAADDLIVISQTEHSVKTVLDVLAGRGASLAADADAGLRGLTESAQGAFVTAAALSVSDLIGSNDHAAVLKNSRMLAIIADEIDGQLRLQIQLEANSIEAAGQIEQVARGMLAFASLQMDNLYLPDVSSMLKAITLTRTDAQLVFSLRYPSAELFSLVKSFASTITPVH